MKISARGSVVKYDSKFKSCTMAFNGTWLPIFVPDSLSKSVVVCDSADVELSLKCKFVKGSKPYVYLVLCKFDEIDIS